MVFLLKSGPTGDVACGTLLRRVPSPGIVFAAHESVLAPRVQSTWAGAAGTILSSQR